MDLPDDEDKEKKQRNVAKDEETELEKPLLPPEVFEHLKNSETEEKKEDKLIMGRKLNLYIQFYLVYLNLYTCELLREQIKSKLSDGKPKGFMSDHDRVHIEVQ